MFFFSICAMSLPACLPAYLYVRENFTALVGWGEGEATTTVHTVSLQIVSKFPKRIAKKGQTKSGTWVIFGLLNG